ncbi:MAG: UDP-2,3-diacylglucosamine diphosphatase LpxI [Rhodospirillales bacterium]|nr:MAG: UDP-2,3-diacylglucosamine diphosphatase LpxI [Rhodospirillales bacterium]
MTARLGIVAGGGRLPKLLIDACRESGRDFFVLALKGQADPEIINQVPHEWIRIGAAGKGFAILKQQGVRELVMAGRVRRPTLRDLRPDMRVARFFARLGKRGLGDDGLLRAVIDEVEGEGFRVVGIGDLLPALHAEEGVLGRVRPDAQAEEDIARGRAVLSALADTDVGQAVVVQQGIVLGIEAVEGTDALLERCGALKRKGPGGVLVKFSKRGQETRVDMPTIGPGTVSSAARAGLRGIAVEAGATIIVDQDELAEAADRADLFVVGIAADQ